MYALAVFSRALLAVALLAAPNRLPEGVAK
jgi:hypothetical protein